MNTVKEIIANLDLVKHPEGGYYREIYRSEDIIPAESIDHRFKGSRNCSTLIYYLLAGNDFSSFHKIKSDEIWHHYEGGTILIHTISQKGDYKLLRLGKNIKAGDNFNRIVNYGTYFAAELEEKTEYALMGCSVSPGFDFRDFELVTKSELLKISSHEIIEKLANE